MALLEQSADRIAAALWNLHPQWAVALGKHEYDGQVPDLSAPAVEAGLERLGRLGDQVAGLKGLTSDEELDREVLQGAVDRERFDGEASRRWRRDPGWYLGPLDVSVYLERDYAPAGLRLEQAAAVLGEAGGLLAAARSNLDEAIPGVWVERAMGAARRRAAGLPVQVEASAACRVAPEEGAWLREMAESASGELEAYAAWLEAERLPEAPGDFALGKERLAEWLRVGEGLDWSAGDLAAAGAACLEEDETDLAAFSSRLEAEPSSAGSWSGSRAEVAPVADPVAALRQAVEQARRFVQEKGLVSLAGDGGLGVSAGFRPGPEAGWLQAAGAYDDPATPAVLYLAAGRVEPGTGIIDDLAVTLSYPGRMLQALLAARASGEARRRFSSQAFEAGWAGYAADLMAEAGYWVTHPQWRLVSLRRAVREDCRLVCVAGLHGGEMTLGEAGSVFVEQGQLDAVAARAEALRCAAGPGAAAGGLGRLVFRRLRHRGGGRPGEPDGAFHDALLSRGALPVGLLDRLLP